MAITDNKTFGWNINLYQALGLLGIIALVVLAIWTNSLVIGYVVMTLALCAFFAIVAFDIGAPDSHKTGSSDEAGGR